MHAHRGGPTLAGVHTFGEETLSAFRNAHLVLGSVIELDAKLPKDGIPVVFHDATLDRTTPCTGRVDARTLAELAACPVDVLGSPTYELGGIPTDRTEPIPTLAQVLAWAREAGATLNLEIKNIPTEADFDPTDAYAEAVMDVVVASGFPAERLIIQSFWPPNLDVAKTRLPGIQTALLTQSGSTNDGGPAFAQAKGYDWVSPQYPIDAAYVERAHAAGRKVIPYTIDQPSQVVAAREMGVDAIITDDPLMARRALGIPDAPSGDREGPVVTLSVTALASSVYRSPTVRLRWRGEDPNGLAGFEAQVRRIGTKPWRTVLLGGRTSVRFKGSPGASYVLRVRAQDNRGNLGEFAKASFVIPLDDRDRRVRKAGAWQRLARARAWMKAVSVNYLPGARASLSFSGQRVRVIGPRFASGGRLEVLLDGRSRVVSVRGRDADRRVLFDSHGIRKGRHTLRLRTLGGGPVALDAIAPS